MGEVVPESDLPTGAPKAVPQDDLPRSVQAKPAQPQQRPTFGGAMELMGQQAGKVAKAFGRGAFQTFDMLTGDNPAEIAYMVHMLGLDEKSPNLGTKIAEFVGGMAIPIPGAGMASKELKTVAATRGMKTIGEEVPVLTPEVIRAARQGHTVGYDFTATSIGGGARRAVETAVGRDKAAWATSARNELIHDRLAKAEIGLLKEQEFSPENLERLRKLAYRPYEEIRKLGKLPPDIAPGQVYYEAAKQLGRLPSKIGPGQVASPFDTAITAAGGRFAKLGESYGGQYFHDVVGKAKEPFRDRGVREVDAGETLDAMKSLRKEATQNLKHYDPANNALGQTQRELANALEARLERYAEKLGQPQLVKNLKAARIQLAKIETVEDSLTPAGHINAHDFARMLEKEVQLSGNFKIIAETAKRFKADTQPLTAAAGKGSDTWSATDFLLGGTGLITGHPGAAAAVLSKPIIRKVIQSEGAQRAMIKKLGKEPNKVVSGVKGQVKKRLPAAAISAGSSTPAQPDEDEQ